MYQYYQPNPCGKSVGDCTVRALSKALNLKWEDAYLILVAEGLRACEMPSSNAVWGEVLRRRGFYTILDHITEQEPRTVYSEMSSYSAGSSAIEYEGESDFAKAIKGRDPSDVWPVMDELMTTIQVIHPRLYTGVMAKLQ